MHNSWLFSPEMYCSLVPSHFSQPYLHPHRRVHAGRLHTVSPARCVCNLHVRGSVLQCVCNLHVRGSVLRCLCNLHVRGSVLLICTQSHSIHMSPLWRSYADRRWKLLLSTAHLWLTNRAAQMRFSIILALNRKRRVNLQTRYPNAATKGQHISG